MPPLNRGVRRTAIDSNLVRIWSLNSIMRILSYVVGMAWHPQSTARQLVEDPYRFREGIAACLLMGVLYTFSVFVGYLHGFGAVKEPWLPIPARDYYLWETFFTIPAFFVILATASAVTQLVARRFRGQGSLTSTFCVLSLGIALPTFLLMWVPETSVLVVAPQLRAEELGGFSFMPNWLNIARQIAVPTWAFWVWVEAMPVVHGLGRLRAAVAVAVGLVPATLVALVIIR